MLPLFSGESGLVSGETPDARTIIALCHGADYSAKCPNPVNFAKKKNPLNFFPRAAAISTHAIDRPYLCEYRFATGMRQSLPNARSVSFGPTAAWRRLCSPPFSKP